MDKYRIKEEYKSIVPDKYKEVLYLKELSGYYEINRYNPDCMTLSDKVFEKVEERVILELHHCELSDAPPLVYFKTPENTPELTEEQRVLCEKAINGELVDGKSLVQELKNYGFIPNDTELITGEDLKKFASNNKPSKDGEFYANSVMEPEISSNDLEEITPSTTLEELNNSMVRCSTGVDKNSPSICNITTDTAKIDTNEDNVFKTEVTTCESNESINIPVTNITNQEDYNRTLKLRPMTKEEQEKWAAIPETSTYTYWADKVANMYTKDQVIEMVNEWIDNHDIAQYVDPETKRASFKEHINSK